MDDLVRAPLQPDSKTFFAKTIRPVCVKPYSELLIPVSCANRFRNRDVRLDPIPGSQFNKFAVARSVGSVKNGTTVCRILNFKNETLCLPRNTRIVAVHTSDVEKEFHPLHTPSDNFEHAVEDSSTNISKQQLENFAAEYGFIINANLLPAQRQELLSVLYAYRSVFARNLTDLQRCPNYDLQLHLKKDVRPFYRRQFKLSNF